MAGAILAALGAKVVAVEPPEGTGARRAGPFAGDEPGPIVTCTSRVQRRCRWPEAGPPEGAARRGS
ncbi:MAG: hypothetical protein GEV08_05400 [Acidimicrobiia bacterium]|nr:hypothetical protein [Acidimicrobiia bacterium]